MRRIAVTVTAMLAVLGALWFGHAPPRSTSAYQRQAVQTVEFLHSQTQTARLWAAAVDRDVTTRQAASVALQEAENDAIATAGRFAGWDPPAGADSVRDTVTGLGEEVVAALGGLRIAAHRGRWTDLDDLAAPLPDLAAHLDTVRNALIRTSPQ